MDRHRPGLVLHAMDAGGRSRERLTRSVVEYAPRAADDERFGSG